jgi:hypothetical protein
LEDVKLGIGNSQKVKSHYNEASAKVAEAREAINRFAAISTTSIEVDQPNFFDIMYV